MSSEDLDKSLRDEVNRHIDLRLHDMQEEIARLRGQVNEAFTRLAERIAGETEQQDAGVAVAISEHIHAARASGIEQAASHSARARAASDVAMLKAAVDDIDNQRAQTDILNALVNRSAAFAPRIIFFVIKNERATAWRARGLEGTIGDAAVREISVPLSAETLLNEAASSRATWSGAPDSHRENSLVLDRLGDEMPPERIVAIPLVARSRAVAVLYADCASLDAEAINMEALETLVRVAGMAVELLAVSRPQPAVSTAPPPPAQAFVGYAPSPAASPMTGARSSPPLSPQTAPEVPSSFTSGVTAPSAPVSDGQPSVSNIFAPAAAPEISSTSFAKVVEPAASTSAAPAVAPPDAPTETPVSAAPLGSARRFGGAAAAKNELPIEVIDDEERRLHTDARRFARILIDEIKLYNEQKVSEGRAGGDLYNRLREEMDRSRQAYDKRVNPRVAARYDYFHHELVNTLAEGNAAKLGADYPGATIRG